MVGKFEYQKKCDVNVCKQEISLFHDIPTRNRTGGGVGIFLRKSFMKHRRDCIQFTSMEYLDLDISHSASSIRLITIFNKFSTSDNAFRVL